MADIVAEKAQYFTAVDVMKDYHQCPLAKECQELTTFITPFEWFKYLHAPFGLSSIAENYNHRMAESLECILITVYHDIVIYGKDPQQHVSHVKHFLQRHKDKKISINRGKWWFGQKQVTFVRFILPSEGYQLYSSIITAISQFTMLTNRSELHSLRD